MLEIALITIFPALMAYAAASDVFTMTIPNKVCLALALAFLAIAVPAGMAPAAIAWHAAAGALALAVCFGLFAAGCIGGGDAKLVAATAIWFGFELVLQYLFAAALFGGALSVAILIWRRMPLPLVAMRWGWVGRLHDASNGVPYGVALAAGALAVFPKSPLWMAVAAG